MNSAAKRIKLDHENQHIWKIGVCCHCNVLLEINSKLLMCLHGICQKCLLTKKLDLGVPCNICKTMTVEKLLDYPAAATKFKICNNLLCFKKSKVYCILCRQAFCNSCSFEHKNFNEEHKRIVDEDNDNIFIELKVNYDQCPNCNNKTVEVFCINCSTVQCALCQLKHHEQHAYKSLEIMTKETKATFVSEKNDLELNAKRIDQCMALLLVQNKELNEKYLASRTQVLKLIDRVIKEIKDRGRELSLLIDSNFKEQFIMINNNKITLEKLKNKNEYYSNFTSSIIDHNTCLYDIELTKVIADKLSTVKTCISSDTPELLSTIKPNLTFEYMDILNVIIQNIKSVGKISSPKIVDLLSIVDQEIPLSNIEVQAEVENRAMEGPSLSSDSTSAENTSLSKVLDNTELVREGTSSNNLLNNDESTNKNHKRTFNTSHMEVITYLNEDKIRTKLCHCCNQRIHDTITSGLLDIGNSNQDLYNCINCGRSYHSNCHVPQITVEMKSVGNSTCISFCTLCQQIDTITAVPTTRHRVLCARLLMELLCTRDYKFNFKYESQIKYTVNGQLFSVNLFLMKLKRRFESGEYNPRVLSFINELKEIFSNVLSLYNSQNRYHLSALILQQSVNDMVNKWVQVPENASQEFK